MHPGQIQRRIRMVWVPLVVFVAGCTIGLFGFNLWFSYTREKSLPVGNATTTTSMAAVTNMTTPRDSCLKLWDSRDRFECSKLRDAERLTTSYHRLWEGDAQMKASFQEDLDRIVASEDFGANEVIQQVTDVGGYHCHEGDKEQPQSEQLNADVEFMKLYADDQNTHLSELKNWTRNNNSSELPTSTNFHAAIGDSTADSAANWQNMEDEADTVKKNEEEDKAQEGWKEDSEEVRDLKWRWADNYRFGVRMPKTRFENRWNVPEDRVALVREMEEKQSDPLAIANRYAIRRVEFADVDYPKQRRIFADYTKAIEWLSLGLNI